jgi:hypothetical protein
MSAAPTLEERWEHGLKCPRHPIYNRADLRCDCLAEEHNATVSELIGARQYWMKRAKEQLDRVAEQFIRAEKAEKDVSVLLDALERLLLTEDGLQTGVDHENAVSAARETVTLAKQSLGRE